ncbi:hypothetical protein BCY86_03380 [Pajaroellobacter abortibovis]|uniref:Uncharacterized protein n=1 Tax=Pajaroellobacter abortibovis TaxID=1882918 RepID=A0A1L6MWL0_9BACT|nr:hypothetical protein BCY86_03380 [Pajaroellobacter abortibovis]
MWGFWIDQTTGKLAPVAGFPFKARGIGDIFIDPWGQFLYRTDQDAYRDPPPYVPLICVGKAHGLRISQARESSLLCQEVLFQQKRGRSWRCF